MLQVATRRWFGRCAPVLAAAVLLLTMGCSYPSNGGESGSDIKTVDLPHTQVKWQSIGNCWLYAALGWAESEFLAATGRELNLSETYLTYRHFEVQLLSGEALDEVNTGGFWRESVRLMLDYGVMREGDFIPDEAEATFSKVQSKALEAINTSLKTGVLSRDRSPAAIRSELDAAFGVTLSSLAGSIVPLDRITLGRDAAGQTRTLRSEILKWTETRWPLNWNTYPSSEAQLPLDVGGTLSAQQIDLLRRVKRALNDGRPVIMNWWVDFNGLDETGTFDLDNVRVAGPGRQGFHSTVIEDYVVTGIDPATGKTFTVGEGEASPEAKRLAEAYGNIDYFIVKNSWGGAERPDRPSYSRFGEKGYSRLNANYLLGWMSLKDEETGEFDRPQTGLTGFILPAGY